MDPLLRLERLTRTYGGLTALDGLDLRLSRGARHAVVGPNGAGKTTLLHLVAGAARPTGGEIRYAGRDITHTGPSARARLGIARTFQTPALCGTLTALDNVVLGAWHHPGTPGPARWMARHRQLVARCREMLDTLGMGAVAQQPAGTLPHGQRRLLEIGTALAARPRLLLLDEPAAGLSEDDLPRLVECLRALSDDVAVLLVEHHLDLVSAVADQVTVLHHGRVLTTGTPTQVTADPEVTDTYLGGRGDG